MARKFISWRRVSTTKQGSSGLGLAAQKSIIDYFVKMENGELIADYEECHTGTSLSTCVELQKAIKQCKQTGAVLIIAKTDRFRTVKEALEILDMVGEENIMFCDLPKTDRFTLTLYTALAEREALLVSIRTKSALQELKKKGKKLGAANAKYKAAIKAKSWKQRKQEALERGASKTRNFLASREVKAFETILKSVFPVACTKANPRDWAWDKVNTKKDNRAQIFTLMRNYKMLDGSLFEKWNFEEESDKRLQQRLSAYIATLSSAYKWGA